MTALVLVETGKEALIRQSKEDVTSFLHQDLLDEVFSHSLIVRELILDLGCSIRPGSTFFFRLTK
jgi:hypothetical protein